MESIGVLVEVTKLCTKKDYHTHEQDMAGNLPVLHDTAETQISSQIKIQVNVVSRARFVANNSGLLT